MAIISLPKTTFDLTVAPQAVENAPQRVLFLGQQVTDTSVDGVLIKNILPNGSENNLFGRRSMLATMIRAYRTINVLSQVDAIPLNDAGGSTAATAVITFTGTATENGTLFYDIQSKFLFTFTIAITSGDTAITVGATFAAAVNANLDVLVTATDNLDGTVDLDFSHGGTVGDTLSLQPSGTVVGISIAQTAFAGGATNPNISTILNQVGDIRYQTIVSPAQYDKSVINAFLEPRFNPTNAVEDGISIMSETADQATLESIAATLDTQNMVLLGNKPVDLALYDGAAVFEFDPTTASYIAAIRTLRLTTGANIADLIVTNAGVGDVFGGPALAAVPYHNTPVQNISVVETELGWSRTEQKGLNNNGISFVGNNPSRNEVIIGDVVTTYLTNAQGQDDTSFKFLNVVDTGSAIREFYVNNNKQEYAQSVLTSGDIVPNSRQVDVNSFNVFQEKLYRQLTVQPFALTVAGSNALNFFKTNINSTINLETGFITTIMQIPIVTQVRGINAILEISFSTQIG